MGNYFCKPERIVTFSVLNLTTIAREAASRRVNGLLCAKRTKKLS